MLCDNCAKILPDNAQICDGCGKPVARREDLHNVSQAATSGPPPLPGAPTPPPMPSTPPSAPQGQYAPPPPPPHQPYATPMGSPYQQPYARPPYGENAPVVTVGEWMIYDLIMMIPFVNFIVLLVWAFGNTNPNRRNKARAGLIWMAIGIGFFIVLVLLGGLAGLSAARYQ